ncbi:MAG: hypothetical protein CMM58_07365 [Rhodospirillaceae bacterium]|nr:hypothetical protein [Rhodospirillaceae bacterium]|tara:strand:- start:776 stop:1384 length:609 start_codon:yes stop_codon:yes gene_type:complete
MIKIYHSTGTRGFRVIWLCEELNIDYVVQKVDFSVEYRSTKEWLRINPLGKVPSLRDGNLLMSESCAMMQYLLDRYGDGRLQPERGSLEYAHFLQWLWFSEATFARPIGEIVNHRREFPETKEIPDVIEEMKGRAFKCVLIIDQSLKDDPYILGKEFSAADISIGYTLRAAKKILNARMPEKVETYLDSLSNRDGFTIAAEA